MTDDALAYLRAPKVSVFRNHHDSWSFVVEVTTKDWVHITIKGRCGLEREAKVSAERALEVAQEAALQLELASLED